MNRNVFGKSLTKHTEKGRVKVGEGIETVLTTMINYMVTLSGGYVTFVK